MDRARCHITEEFKKALEELDIEIIFLPGCLTGKQKFLIFCQINYSTKFNKKYSKIGLLQPADVGWFKLLKLLYKKAWLNWFLTGVKRFTVHGNLAGPGYQLMTKWILDGWLSFDSAQIINSFRYCGITCDSDLDYHSELKTILTSEKLPPNSTVEPATDLEDPNFAHVLTMVSMMYLMRKTKTMIFLLHLRAQKSMNLNLVMVN